MSLLALIEQNVKIYKKTQPLDILNSKEVLNALWNINLEKIAEYYVNGSLNLRLCFPSYRYHATIWHVLANKCNSENTQLLKDILVLYEKCYSQVVSPEELNTYHAFGLTPIHVAAYAGNIEVIKILVEAGADPTLKHRDEDSNVIDMLNESWGLNEEDKNRLTEELEKIIEDYKKGLYKKPHPITQRIEEYEAKKHPVKVVNDKSWGRRINYFFHTVKDKLTFPIKSSCLEKSDTSAIEHEDLIQNYPQKKLE